MMPEVFSLTQAAPSLRLESCCQYGWCSWAVLETRCSMISSKATLMSVETSPCSTSSKNNENKIIPMLMNNGENKHYSFLLLSVAPSSDLWLPHGLALPGACTVGGSGSNWSWGITHMIKTVKPSTSCWVSLPLACLHSCFKLLSSLFTAFLCYFLTNLQVSPIDRVYYAETFKSWDCLCEDNDPTFILLGDFCTGHFLPWRN